MKAQIKKGEKGIKLNLPAFGAYKTIFGEGSSFMKEVEESLVSDAREHWEYIKALQIYLSDNADLLQQVHAQVKDKYNLADLSKFYPHTGVFRGTPEDVKRSLSGTVYDVEKFTKPFFVDIPSTTPGKREEKEPFYVPGPLARGVYPEPQIAGEFGPRPVARRIQQVINAAKEVEEIIAKPEADFLDFQEAITQLPKIVGGMAKKAKNLAGVLKRPKRYAPREEAEIEDQLREMLSKIQSVLRPDVLVDPKILQEQKVRGVVSGTQVSELEYINKYLDDQISRIKEFPEDMRTVLQALSFTIARAADLAVGKGTKDTTILTSLDRALRDGEESVRQFAESVGAGGSKEKRLDSALASLSKAKIKYYEELAKTAIGKEGSVAKLAFSRRIPSVMGKAITATVSREKEISSFTRTLSGL